MADTTFQIEEKIVEPVLVAGVRMRGKYSDCGKAFGQIGRKFGSKLNGKAMLLCYDTEYKEDDADFEPCMPVKKGEDTDGIKVHELPKAKCVTLVHQGPYETLRNSYEKLFAYIAEKGYELVRPSREVYLKGPGMIFKGNPKKYLTEIQIVVAE
jgi:effector-binding domain-containing protein